MLGLLGWRSSPAESKTFASVASFRIGYPIGRSLERFSRKLRSLLNFDDRARGNVKDLSIVSQERSGRSALLDRAALTARFLVRNVFPTGTPSTEYDQQKTPVRGSGVRWRNRPSFRRPGSHL
jgi:hypothetical protein